MSLAAPPTPDLRDPARDEIQDAVIKEAKLRARRRRRNYGVLAGVATAAIAALMMLDRTPPSQNLPLIAEGPSPTPTLELLRDGAPTIPYCVSDPNDRTGPELIVGAGPVVKTWCRFHPFPHIGDHRYLWYHAGQTILTAPNHVYRVDDGRLTELARDSDDGNLRISEDGRYAAWLAATAPSGGPGILTVYDLIGGRRVAAAGAPSHLGEFRNLWPIEAIDRRGRVYGGATEDHELWVYDIATERWGEVKRLPQGWMSADNFGSQMSYTTENGFAVTVRQASASEPVAKSVEGRVTADGRFVPVREVPIGKAAWSPDGSRFVQLTAEGFWVQPAHDFDVKVVLHLPFSDPQDWHRVWWDAQWESETTVLLSLSMTPAPEDFDVEVDPNTGTVRCFVDTGHCERLVGIDVPLSNIAHPGG